MSGAPPTTGGGESEEVAFRKWYFPWSVAMGLDPNPDDPRHQYDYRAAYRAGVEPAWDYESKELHWPADAGGQKLKRPEHPTFSKEDALLDSLVKELTRRGQY